MANTKQELYDAEVKRKARNGQALTDSSNAQGNALYNQTQSTHQTEINRKADSGIALTNPNAYASGLYEDRKLQNFIGTLGKGVSDNDQSPVSSGTQRSSFDGSAQMDSILAQLKAMGQAGYESTVAGLTTSRENQLADLKKSYNAAVEAGEMSVREAQDAFAAQSKAIDQQQYNDSQATNLMATQRGISNSQQMLGMQASDAGRANSNRSTAQTAMNSSISDIRQRLNSIKLNKDLDVNRVNTEFDMARIEAQAARDSQYAQGAYDLGVDDYQASRDFDYERQMLDAQTAAQEGLMGKQAGIDSAMMDKQTAAQIQLMERQSGISMNEMKVKLGLDKDMASFMGDIQLMQMAKSFGYDLEKMKQSNVYETALQNARLAADAKQQAANRAQSAANANKAAQSQNDGYALALQRELAKYQKGTPEYDIVQAQIAQDKKRADDEMLSNFKNDVAMEKVLNNPNIDIMQYRSFDELVGALNSGAIQNTTNLPKPTFEEAVKATWQDSLKNSLTFGFGK